MLAKNRQAKQAPVIAMRFNAEWDELLGKMISELFSCIMG
jgi:hypothetical protein